MQKTDFMWVDLDVYCLRRIDYQKDYYFGMNFKKGMMSNCVLKILRNSIALHLVRNFLDSDVPIPFWWRRERLMTFLDEIASFIKLVAVDDHRSKRINLGSQDNG